jgi:Tol biopolymer transport system component
VTGQNPALSPDGNKVALDASPEGDRDVWVADVQRGVTMKVTTGGGMDRSAVWSPDGRRIAFARGRKIYVTNADGSGDAEVLVDAEGFPESWSRDGRYLLYRFGQALHLWPFDGGKPVPIGRGGNARWAQFSPDSRAVAYVSNESGRDEVYVQMVPPATGRVQVSATGGAHPRWGRTSSELLFVTADRMMTSVELGYRDGPVAGAAKKLFPLEVGSVFTNTRFDFDAARDRFLIPRISGESLSDVPITVVLNWWTELLEKPD